MSLNAIAPWYGGKRAMAAEIVAELGEHNSYWELFAGSCAVLFGKERSRNETVNDLHGDLVILARVIASDQWWELADRIERTPFCEELFSEASTRLREGAEDEVDRAYNFLVSSWMGVNGITGTDRPCGSFAARFTSNGGCPATRWRSVGESLPEWHERLCGVMILRRDAFGLLERIEDKSGTVIYLDPPYIEKSDKYKHDFGDEGHQRLAELAKRFKKTRVVISYYRHPSLTDLYPDWTTVCLERTKTMSSAGGKQVSGGGVIAPEVLLINGDSRAKSKSVLFD